VTHVCAQCLIDGAVPVFSTRIRHQNGGSEMSIYFTFELPETHAGHTWIAMVVDKFSKQGHFLTIETERFSSRLSLYILSRDLPSPCSTIKDHFRQRHKIYVQVQVNNTEARRNQTQNVHSISSGDRRTDKTCLRSLPENNSTVVDVLQRDRGTHIAQLEFAYNSTVNDSTGQAPVYVASRQLPTNCYDALLPAPSMPDADVNTAAKHIVSKAQRAMNAARKVLADTFFTLTQRLNQARRHRRLQHLR
jgi:hypothetical protein